MSKLILNPGRPDQRTFELPSGTHVIGRDAGATVRCEEAGIAGQHALLTVNREGAVLEDLGSGSGILCEGERTDFKVLLGGEIFRCGEATFYFVHEAPPTELDAPLPQLTVDVRQDLSRRSIDELLQSGEIDLEQREASSHARLQILLKVSQLLSSPDTIDSVLERILRLVFQILDVDRAAILMIDPESGELETKVSEARAGVPRSERIYSQNIVAHVRENKVAALFADATADPRIDPSESIVQQSIRSSMCAPLMPKDEVIGVLYVDNVTTPFRFGQEDLEFLSAFASQAGIAIENSRLYRKLEEETVARTNLTRFFPPSALNKILGERDLRLEAVDTEITALFSDISGFTAMSSRMPPREVVALLNDYFPTMSELVFNQEGTLEKYIGDALMAVWGWPYSHPRDADRALLCAVGMQRAMRAFNDMKGSRYRFEIHIGMNSGPVAAGNIGSHTYIQLATIGDATNVAARVCNVAGPGEIVISEATYRRLTADVWPVDALGPIPVKGKDEPVPMYRIRWEEAPTRLD